MGIQTLNKDTLSSIGYISFGEKPQTTKCKNDITLGI